MCLNPNNPWRSCLHPREVRVRALSCSHLLEGGTSAAIAAAFGVAELYGANTSRKLKRALALLGVGVAGAGAHNHEHFCLATQRVLEEVGQLRVTVWRVFGLGHCNKILKSQGPSKFSTASHYAEYF